MPILGKTTREVLTEFRMAELVAAARKVFSKRGFHDATREEIGQLAGVAKGTIYLYYPSKRVAYWAAYASGTDDCLRVWERRRGHRPQHLRDQHETWRTCGRITDHRYPGERGLRA